MTDDDRVFLSFDEAVAMLPDKPDIHTFRNLSFMLIGADWSRPDIESVLRKHKPELAGEMATNMGHGLVVIDEIGSLFIETAV
jgi:hypothetical protein